MPLIEISYKNSNNRIVRNWIDIDSIQSITDGDGDCTDYNTIIEYPDRKMFFDRRTPQQFIRDIRDNRKWV